jgi:2-oxoglutarate ferredoxin oxidoreductase subunit alpha
MERTVVKIAGASGMGLLSSGHIMSRALKRLGFYIALEREFPSLIKGGSSNVQIDFSTKEIRSLSTKIDVVVALDRAGLLEYIDTIKRGGILIHGYERHQMIPELKERAKKRGIKVLYLPARQIARSLGGSAVMVNMVLLGLLWKVLGLKVSGLKKQVSHQFASKPKLLKIDLLCVDAGYKGGDLKNIPQFKVKTNKKVPKKILIDGTTSIALGAIQAGLRTYYAYPMSPSSGILTYIAKTSHETKILVKQAEDEITAAQMVIGSMYVGTRAMTATSGGGYDLMTESVSLAGMNENPLVIIIGQRPGPATGLPTWTSQGDFNLAIHSAHGEFPRAVVCCSDPQSSYEMIQHAFNIAEEYQIPVTVLSEKTVYDTHRTVDHFKHKQIPIKRGLVTNPKELENLKSSDRYKITDSGISKRWVPGTSPAPYYANGDEHWESGELNEEEDKAIIMIEKRMRKEKTLLKSLPAPKIYGVKKNADISFIGWGSSKNAVLDAIDAQKKKGVSVNYLHYDYLWPVKADAAKKFFENNKKVHLVEGNYQGQFGQVIEAQTQKKFKGKLLKFSGRPFFFDDIMSYVDKKK